MLPAVKVEGLWKEYVVGQSADRTTTFYDLISKAIGSPFGRSMKEADDRFWALRDVSFEVQPGEVVGIIGRNGAGKSTLLKILSRITAPTKGRVEVRGRLASLLEVGTGFHPELSGRENIYLNGAILGMTRRDIQKKFDEIVAFAEVEKFIDTPVKRYSSGMYVRLAFAVAAHLDCDVLVIDEVLAVGDSAFQQKCLAQMNNLSALGRSVLLVSHDLSTVSKLCTKGVLLSQGQVTSSASISSVIDAYLSISKSGIVTIDADGPLTGCFVGESIALEGEVFPLTSPVSPLQKHEFDVTFSLTAPVEQFRLRFEFFARGEKLFSVYDQPTSVALAPGTYRSRVTVPARTFGPGDYLVEIVAFSDASKQWARLKNLGGFTVSVEWEEGYEPTHAMGLLNVSCEVNRARIGAARE